MNGIETGPQRPAQRPTARPAGAHGNADSDRRLRRRKRAEIRLRAYGVLALTLAMLALGTLLWSVVRKAGDALTESYVELPVTLDAAAIAPQGTAAPEAILRADFGGLTKATLRAAFPQARARRDKKALYDLVSGGASFELARKVAANPGLIGQTINFDFLASDTVDLYLKGAYGRLQPVAAQGGLTLEIGKRVISVKADRPVFAAALARVKARKIRDAERLRRQAARQQNGVNVFTARARAATTAEERQANLKAADRARAKAAALIGKAAALEAAARNRTGPEKLKRTDPSVLLRADGGWIKMTRIGPDQGQGKVLIPLASDSARPDKWQLYITELPERARRISDKQIIWVESLRHAGKVKTVFNWRFFTAADSREPELAGIRGAAVGSFWTMLVTFLLSFPIGVLAAIYLEEFAPRNRWTDFIEVNINNLAAVPSIVFGLLGLAVFIGFFGVPRSAPLAGGIVLAIMTLPTIIIASRASIAAVPPSIRDAALGVGASRLQMAFHHVLPLSLPGILTGTIIGMARALGETAPLIMIGMVAFIVDVPKGITDSATVLPVQIYRWSDFPERAFEARTAAAISVLILFLIVMNGLAVFLRRRFERRW